MPSVDREDQAAVVSLAASHHASDHRFDVTPSDEAATPKRGLKFWLVFLALGISGGVNMLELSALSTALPTIIHELGGGTTFIWVGSAYALCATAFVPLSGNLAEVLGRRPVMLASLLLMAAGSAICGASTSMSFLIAGRVIQGLGGGGIAATTAIIISDMVPLQERGVFNGLVSMAWAIFLGLGPIIAGALVQVNQWRWIFYLNIPINGLAAILLLWCLRVPTPPGSARAKLLLIDWIGNALIVAASTSTVIGLTWGGTTYPWSSANVIVPLVLGLSGLVAFLLFEAKLAKQPVVPFELMSTITGLSGYLQTFFAPVMLVALAYYAPVYFQACKGYSPIHAGVELLAIALVVPAFSVIAGSTVKRSGVFRPQLWFAWATVLVGMSLLTTVKADYALGYMVGYMVISAVGLGILYSATYFPVLAPLDVSQNALALSFFIFLRNFAQVWGITVGGTVLQNELQSRVPADVLTGVPGVAAGSLQYALIPVIQHLPAALRDELRVAFAESLQTVWKVFTGIAALGLLSSLPMRGLPLHAATDAKWALQEKGRQNRAEIGERKVG